MYKKIGYAAISGVTLASMVLMGCNKPQAATDVEPNDSTSTNPLVGKDYNPEKGVAGGKVIFSDWQFPESMNPLFNDSLVGAEVMAGLWDGLIGVDNKLKYFADLAQQVPTTDNGLVKVDTNGGMTVKVTLRKGLKWSDGQPITSDDIIYGWNTIMDKDTGTVTTSGYDQIDKIDKVDDRTVVLNYKKVYGAYLSALPMVLPKHAWGSTSPADLSKAKFSTQPTVTSGPFTVSEFKADDHITLLKNPNYTVAWKGHAAYFDTVKFVGFATKDGQIASLGKDTDISEDYTSADLPKLDKAAKDNNLTVYNSASLTYEHLDFNLTKDIFKDVNVRKAIQLGIDKNSIVQDILKIDDPDEIKATVAASPEAPLAWDYDTDLEASEFDVDAAKKLLDDAGWKVDPKKGGIRYKAGKPFKFEFSTTAGNAVRSQVAEFVQKEMKALGIDMSIKTYPSGKFFNPDWKGDGPLVHGTYDLAMFAWVASNEPDGNYSIFNSTQIPTAANNGTGQNYNRTNDPDIDKALDDGRGTVDIAKRIEAYKKYQQAISDNVYIIPLYYRPNISTADSSIHNYVQNPSSTTNEWNVVDWYKVQ